MSYYIYTLKKPDDEILDKDHIIMGWDYSGDINLVKEKSSKTKYNTVSPIWYHITGNKTDYESLGLSVKTNKEYIKLAHKNGYKVWAMLSDGFSPTRSKLLFDNDKKEDEIIDKLVDDVIKNNIDGVNLDFEGDGRKNTKGFLEFSKKLSNKLKEHNKVLSIDVTGYDNFMLSSYYDRKELSKFVDYLCFMGYDEHWSGSKVAGSVSSIDWVEKNIIKMLKEVPSEKIILAVPFYTRVWRVVEGEVAYVDNAFVNIRSKPDSNSNKLGVANKNEFFKFKKEVKGQSVGESNIWLEINYEGKTAYIHSNYSSYKNYFKNGRVSTKAYSISRQNKMLEQRDDFKIEYVKEDGQNLAVALNNDESKYKIWLEDEISIKNRSILVNQYDLAGISAWRLNYEDENTWEYYNKYLKETKGMIFSNKEK